MKKYRTDLKLISVFFLLFLATTANSQTLSGDDLLSALQEGGHIIVMRHASSPRQVPDAETANADNVNLERQLDDEGRKGAAVMGESLRRLGISLSEVESSPTYRALETARLAGFTQVDVYEELSNQGMRTSGAANAAWMLARVAATPQQGNRLLITHYPNVAAAFPGLEPGLEDGEALVFDPGVSTTTPIARIKISAWAQF